LTAYVDGELDARQCQLVQRLLQRSKTAQALLRRLQQDAAALRRLPRQQLGANFAQQILQTVAAQPAPPVSSAPRPVRASLSAWMGWAVAAAILFLVGTGSYLYFADALPEGPVDTIVAAGSPEASARANPEKEPDPERLAVLPADRKPDAPASASPRPPEAPRPATVAMNPGLASTSAAEQPGPTERPPSESGTGTLLTAPNTPAEKFREVLDPGLPTPLRFRFRELELEKRRLQEELQKDRAY